MKTGFWKGLIQKSESLMSNTLRIFLANIALQAVSFFTLPVFSRIYSPSDYGWWGIFMFVCGIAAVVSCLRYEMALMIPKEEDEALHIFHVAQSINFIFLLFFFATVVVFNDLLFQLLQFDFYFLLLIPAHIFFTGYNNLLIQWISRKKLFNHLVVIRGTQTLLNIILSFVFGWYLRMEFRGLILATVLSVAVTDIGMMIKYRKGFVKWSYLKPTLLKATIQKYSNFAYYSSPLALLNFGTGNILYYIIQTGYGSAATGIYANAVKIIQTPFSLISTSFSSVFYQHFSRSEKRLSLFVRSFFGLTALFTFLLLPFIFFGKEIIVWYLGDQWAESADYIVILSLFMIFSFAMSSVSTVLAYYQRERIVLVWQICFLLAVLGIFVILPLSLYNKMWFYSITGALAYMLLFFIAFLLVKKKERI